MLAPIFKRRNGRHWPEIKGSIEASMDSMKTKGYCWASWQPEVVAVATAFTSAEGICVMNVSVSTQEDAEHWVAELAPKLMRLKEDIRSELSRLPEP